MDKYVDPSIVSSELPLTPLTTHLAEKCEKNQWCKASYDRLKIAVDEEMDQLKYLNQILYGGPAFKKTE
jgi:hypothetical protein